MIFCSQNNLYSALVITIKLHFLYSKVIFKGVNIQRGVFVALNVHFSVVCLSLIKYCSNVVHVQLNKMLVLMQSGFVGPYTTLVLEVFVLGGVLQG